MADIAAKLVIDIQGAIKSIENFTKEGGKSLSNIERAANGVERALGAVATAFAYEKIKEGFHAVIDASADAEKSFGSMVSALKLSNSYSDSAVKSFERLAEEIQANSIYDDDLVLSQVALAKSFNTTNKEAEKLIRAAVDLAAYTGQDLPTAIGNLGKTLDGSLSGKLAEAIPGLKGFTEEQLRAGAAVDFVLNRFKGSAAAATTTYAGAIAQAKNSVSNLKEAIGDLIIKDPLVIKMIQNIAEFAKKLQQSEDLKRLVLAIAAGVGTLGLFAAGFAYLSTVMAGASAAAAAFGITLGTALGPITLAVAGIAALAGAIVYLKKRADETPLEKVNRELDSSADKVKNLQTLISRYETMANEATNSVSKAEALEQLPKLKAQLVDAEEAMRKLSSAAVAQAAVVGKAIEKNGGTADRVAAAAKEAYVKHLNKIKEEFENLKEKFGDFGLTETQRIIKNYSLEQRKLDELYQNKKINEEDFNKYSERLIIDRNKKIEAYEKERFQKVYSNPLAAMFDKDVKFGGKKDIAASGLGFLNSALQGEAGAKSLIAAGAGAAADAYLPGSGAAVSQIVSVLAEGEDKVRETVKSFVDAFPVVIKNIVKAAPVVIVELIKGVPKIMKEIVREIPDLIDALIEAIPDIIAAFIEALPDIIEAMVEMAPRIMEGVLRGLGKLLSKIFGDSLGGVFGKLGDGLLKIPGVILNALKDGIPNILKGIVGGGGGIPGLGSIPGIGSLPGVGGVGGGGVFGRVAGLFSGRGGFGVNIPGLGGGGGLGIGGSIGGWDFSFADGALIPPGYPNDSYFAKVESNEMILPQRPAKSYQEIMGDGPESLQKKLDKLTSDAGAGSQQFTINLLLNEKTLASAIYDLNKRGFRLS